MRDHNLVNFARNFFRSFCVTLFGNHRQILLAKKPCPPDLASTCQKVMPCSMHH